MVMCATCTCFQLQELIPALGLLVAHSCTWCLAICPVVGAMSGKEAVPWAKQGSVAREPSHLGFLIMPRHCGAGLHGHDGQVYDQAGVGGCELLHSHESSEEALCTYRPFCKSAVLFQQGTRYNESHFPPWYLVWAFMEACSF